MAFTANSDLYGAIHEEGINLIVHHMMRQRPSLFNYATDLIEANICLLCHPIEHAPGISKLLTVVKPIPILGTEDRFGIDFCFQIDRAKIDLHPGSMISLPSELNPPLGLQRLAIFVRVCVGMGCTARPIPPPEFEKVLPPPPDKELQCFCLNVFATGNIEVKDTTAYQKLYLTLDKVEVVDIIPSGLERSLECYLATLVQIVILPKLVHALEKLVLKVLNLTQSFIGVTLSLPTAAPGIPNNPATEDEQLRLFIKMEVAP